MADDEQFSLCWNNFNSNLSAGFHESLQRGDLVDVTLAAEGQLVQAHRLVLSVCSPYFRKMFNQMPKNQHAFVFLKDVTHAALQDLIQFMYCGEVNVKQDALPAFISTAEALQIKGLTETGDSAPSQQSPVKEDVSAVPSTTASISTTVPAASQRTKVQRNRVQSSYKIESEESGDDKIHIQASTSHHVSAQQLQTQTNISSQKRTMPQRGITSHTIKRQKISISASSDGMDTSDTAPSQTQTVQTVQIVKQLPAQVIEPEYIELPMESINPKAEPDYTDETAEIETVDAETEQEHKLSEQGDADDDGNYVEDETYGDMAMGKYEESYLTEAEDGAKPGASGFVETYASDGGTGTEQSTQGRLGLEVDLSNELTRKLPDVTLFKTNRSVVAKRKITITADAGTSASSLLAHHGTPAVLNDNKLMPTLIKAKKALNNSTVEVVKPNVNTVKTLHNTRPNPDDIVKQLSNGHTLVKLVKTRVRGFCVSCIRKIQDPEYKKKLQKIITYCSACPAGQWTCVNCFDESHGLKK
ncbi:modifier of mdg4-like isoform X10 [Anopheles moucheti]|uniref:modifier of mdg4-like isoform X10 n=1 Tax=Anopheles moucheti TaxID=186751 RepID=UPI0022F02D0D|nr:modifier of mdg4-like isoform X10 [Anopheles moucheti]